jgi:hypothetical protein
MSGWVAGAIVVGGVIGAVGSNMAANTQANAQKQAAATQAGMFNTITGQEQPFMQAGYGATTDLNELMGISPATGKGGTAGGTGLPGGYLTQQFNPTQEQLNNYPGYQFQQQAGQLATESAATPGTGAISGPGLKSLMNYNQGLAASNYGNYFNQFQTQQNNIFDRLNQIATRGQNAAGNLGTAGTTLGTGIAQAQAGAGASQAGGIVGATNSIGGSGVPLAYLMSGAGNANNNNWNFDNSASGTDMSYFSAGGA